MPFSIIKGDITKLECDAIVNAANRSLLGGGGVDGAIHRAAGPELLNECRGLGGCNTGEAKATKGYRLPCKHVIHTVGPIWHGGDEGEEALLRACYSNSLRIASELGCESVAFPLISSGVYGYPKDKAMSVAMDVISAFLRDSEMEVILVIFGAPFAPDPELFRQVEEAIEPRDADNAGNSRKPPMMPAPAAMASVFGLTGKRSMKKAKSASLPDMELCEEICLERAEPELEALLDRRDESFSQALMRMIDERGMTDVETYKGANLDRKLFSKIRSDVDYRPKKTTACAFAIALHLTVEEAELLLDRAGFSLSETMKFDKVIRYFLSRRVYDIFEINSVLFAYDLPILGGRSQ